MSDKRAERELLLARSILDSRRLRLFFIGALLGLSGCGFDPEAGRPPPGKTSTYSPSLLSRREYASLDLLFVIDNSPSMASKGVLLSRRIPAMVERLTNPRCRSGSGEFLRGEESCPRGYQHEFDAVTNLNIGFISSSLGGQGSASCPDGAAGHNYNDGAHLIPTVRAGVPDPSGQGFLTWRREGDEELQQLLVDLKAQIEAVGSDGCEYPASLEAWYRFLVEPSPPLQIVVDERGHSAPLRDESGDIVIDEELLAQRAAFLRPKGLVAIINVTDKNDCSAMVGESGFEGDSLGRLALERGLALPRPTSICAQSPNDACCVSCLNASVAPTHCDLSECEEPEVVPPEEDPLELRCFDQRRRFGMDFLFPLSRYVDGLTENQVRDWQSGELVDNPLFRGVGKNVGVYRSGNNVLYSGIVGAPWQDLVDTESLWNEQRLHYLYSGEYERSIPSLDGPEINRWQMHLGEPNLPARSPVCVDGDARCGRAPIPPFSPFMIESVEPRETGLRAPITGELIAASDSLEPAANRINGHESEHGALEAGARNNELQNACTISLPEAFECEEGDPTCECAFEPSRDRAVCQSQSGTSASNIQVGAGAKPSTRVLSVMQQLDWFAPDSICAPEWEGAAPGDGALVQELGIRNQFTGARKCYPNELAVNEEGMVSCSLLEMTLLREELGGSSVSEPDCNAAGRKDVSPEQREHILRVARGDQLCDGSSGIPCDEFKVCALPQLQGEERQQCLHDWLDESAHPKPGFCYIDAKEPLAGGEDNRFVANCPATQRRLFRVVGKETPRYGSLAYMICQDQELGERDFFATGGAAQIPELPGSR